MRSLLLFLFLATPLAAQTGRTAIEQVDPRWAGRPTAGPALLSEEAVTRAVLEPAADPSVAAIALVGLGNSAGIDQTGGPGNRAGVVLDGDGNEVSVAQDGAENVFLALIRGDHNRLTGGVQQGDGNAYVLVLNGVSGSEHALVQTGGGNSAVQLVGPGATPVSVVQFGGARAEIVRR